MRIHLPLEPKHFTSNPTGPLAKIGGDLVLIELQGRIEVEGDTANSVIGVLGLDRPVSTSHRHSALRLELSGLVRGRLEHSGPQLCHQRLLADFRTTRLCTSGSTTSCTARWRRSRARTP